MRPNWTTITLSSLAIVGGTLLLLLGGDAHTEEASMLFALAAGMVATRPAFESEGEK